MGNEESSLNNTSRNSNSTRKSDSSGSGVGTAIGVGVGVAAVGAAIIGAMAYANSKKEEEKRSENPVMRSYTPVISAGVHEGRAILRPTPHSRYDSDDGQSDHDDDDYSSHFQPEGRAIRREVRSNYEVVYEAVVQAANETNAYFAINSDRLVHSFQDYRHNQYRNKFCQILKKKLDAKGIPFEKEKTIDYIEDGKLKSIRLDVYIKGIAFVEIKCKERGIKQDDREQMERYVRVTNLPGILINFGTQGGPHIRVFRN